MAVAYSRYKFVTVSLPKRFRNGRFTSETAVLKKNPLELLESSICNSFSRRRRWAWLLYRYICVKHPGGPTRITVTDLPQKGRRNKTIPLPCYSIAITDREDDKYEVDFGAWETRKFSLSQLKVESRKFPLRNATRICGVIYMRRC